MSEPAEPVPQVDSPCIGTCTLGPSGLCIGCFRTGEEIAAWLSYSAARRREIMAELPRRAHGLFDEP